jgi:hypothetical protein
LAQFYSTRAYEFVRKKFLNALPHVATIRKWYSSLEGGPGFCTVAFTMLQQKVDEEKRRGKQVLLSVMIDDMSIKKKIDYDSKESKFVGFVDFGTGKLLKVFLA